MLYLMFTIGTARYLLRAAGTEGVLPLVRLKSIAGTPSWVAGLFEYRHQLVPVIDVSYATLGIASALKISTRIAMIQLKAEDGQAPRLLGLILEQATDTIRVSDAEFEPSPVTLPGSQAMGAIVKRGQTILQRIEPEYLLPEPLRIVLYGAQARQNESNETSAVAINGASLATDDQNKHARKAG